MNIRPILKQMLPPIVGNFCRRLGHAIRPPADGLLYAPDGWETVLPASSGQGYASPALVAEERRSWESFLHVLQQRTGAIVAHAGVGETSRMLYEHNYFMTFGYVLALATGRRARLKLLDYGGSVGGSCRIARMLLPGIELEYHCKELPGMARAGREFCPEVIWHTDNSCLEESYDLIVFQGSLQYVREWKALLRAAGRATRDYLFLTDVPLVERVPSFTAVQRLGGVQMMHQQFNKSELFAALHEANLTLEREFWVGDYPAIRKAPEQPSRYGCLMRSCGASG
jgi:putative methyltransferase (TIGR04325 family)